MAVIGVGVFVIPGGIGVESRGRGGGGEYGVLRRIAVYSG